MQHLKFDKSGSEVLGDATPKADPEPTQTRNFITCHFVKSEFRVSG